LATESLNLIFEINGCMTNYQYR